MKGVSISAIGGMGQSHWSQSGTGRTHHTKTVTASLLRTKKKENFSYGKTSLGKKKSLTCYQGLPTRRTLVSLEPD